MPMLILQRPHVQLVAPTPYVRTHTCHITADNVHLVPGNDLDIQSLDDDGETELEPATIYDVHIMEEIDCHAQEQQWEPGEANE
jgi:hypothetical protein